MPPTTRDLAQAAGVSLATVDRVLNGRSGVRMGTVERVNQAIREIGFVRNASAATLARGRALRFRFLLPRSDDLFVRSLRARIAEANLVLAAEMVELSVDDLPQSDPHAVAAALASLDPGDVDGVAIMAPESPQTRDAIRRLRERGLHAVALVSGYQDAEDEGFVGIDDRAAGATAARLMGRFSCGRAGTVLVVGETMQLRNEIERRVGFDAVLQADFPHLRAMPSLETRRDGERAVRILRNAAAAAGRVVGAYILSTEARLAAEAIRSLDRGADWIVIAHERTGFTEEALRSGAFDAVIAQDPGHLVRSATRRLRAACEGRRPIASQEAIRIEVLLRDNL